MPRYRTKMYVSGWYVAHIDADDEDDAISQAEDMVVDFFVCDDNVDIREQDATEET